MKKLLSCFIAIILILNIRVQIFPQTAAKKNAIDSAIPVYQLLNRIIPGRASTFHLSLIADANKNEDEFVVEASNGIVDITGNSKIALTRGIYYYLRNATHSMITWSGNHIDLPKILPSFPKTKITSPYEYRLYYNVCTFGYTTAFWDWDQWQKEIDWMALHGINMPLAMVGQEAIWRQVWKSLGVSDKDLSNYFTGPAFLPWNRMGNINKHDGPLPQSYIDKSVLLQKKILQRMRELGMKPIVPAFSGYVPEAIAKIYPDSKIIKMKTWDGFPNVDGTYMLSPLSKHFKEIGKKFIEEYRKVYGASHFYLADAFNEMTVPVSNENRYNELADFGRSIFSSINAGDSTGVWIMQGWLFHSDAGFWDKNSVKALLRDVPDDRMIIIDLANESFHGWKKLDGFYGKKWIYSIIHNFGGHNQYFGNLPFYAKDPIEMLSDSAHGNLVGFGISPEGIENNEVVYELLTDMAWVKRSPVLSKWIADYSLDRYGAYPVPMQKAWNYLLSSIYSTDIEFPRYFYQLRPRLSQYNDLLASDKFDSAVVNFLQCSGALRNNRLYVDDAVQLTAQYASTKIDFLLNRAVHWHLNHNYKERDKAFKDAFILLKNVDELLNEHPLYRLKRWINFARRWGNNGKEADYYESDAKRQITTWGGPNLSEYAAKMWSGLIEGYYLPRWKLFADSLRTGSAYDIYNWEEKWITTATKNKEVKRPRDTIKFALDLINEANKYFNEFSEQVEINIKKRNDGIFYCSLKSRSSGLKIYYTTNNEVPNNKSISYVKPFAVSLPSSINAIAYKYGQKFGDVVHRVFSLDYASKVTLLTSPSSKYESGGPDALTDGVTGSLDFKDGKWTGFEGNDLEAVVDLGKKTFIDRISAGFLQDTGSWIFLPDSVQYSVSDNGKEFHRVAGLKNNVFTKEKGPVIKSFEAHFNRIQARYIKIYAKNIGVCPPWHSAAGSKAWLFVDEVNIY